MYIVYNDETHNKAIIIVRKLMKSIRKEEILSIGLALFSMLFGAGNLIYPLQLGMECGNTWYGLLGFMITGVCLPFAGLIGILLFDGNYRSFYGRLGTFPGRVLLFISIMLIGPILAIPRTVALSHAMLAPFLPSFLNQITILSSFVFAFIFLGLTFLATYREHKIVPILGNIISPLLLLSLGIIIGSGLWNVQTVSVCAEDIWHVFKDNFVRGYETLDLISAIFFASIVLSLLKRTIGLDYNPRVTATVGLQSGLIGMTLLGVVYIGLAALSGYYGQQLVGLGIGELLHTMAFNILGTYGAFFVSLAVLMACLSTAVALSAVVAEYVERTLFRENISFSTALVMVMVASVPLATFGLDKVLRLAAGPIVYIAYPVLITLTMCNIAYKVSDFKWVKVPVLITFIAALISYLW
jgi:LIVCS family branched-chain amino acid:cation transporter